MDSEISGLTESFINNATIDLINAVVLLCRKGCRRQGRFGIKQFVNVEKISISNFSIVDLLVECADNIRSYGFQLVIEITERPLLARELTSQYLDGLMRLKENGISVAMDDYNVFASKHLELDYNLCDLVKIDILDLHIPLQKDNGFIEVAHTQLYRALIDFVEKYRVLLVAEKVETDWQAVVVSGLPFTYFQGYAYGRPFKI